MRLSPAENAFLHTLLERYPALVPIDEVTRQIVGPAARHPRQVYRMHKMRLSHKLTEAGCPQPVLVTAERKSVGLSAASHAWMTGGL